MDPVKIVSVADVEKRSDEILAKAKEDERNLSAKVKDLRAQLNEARNLHRLARHERKRLESGAFVTGTYWTQRSIDAMNDLISTKGDLLGQGPVDAYIDPDLAEMAGAVINLTRGTKARAVFEMENGQRVCRVLCLGRGSFEEKGQL